MTNKRVVRLIEAVEHFGLDNVSTVADYAGLPTETARYMIWNEFENHLISIGVDVDLEGLGLQRSLLSLEFGQKDKLGAVMNFLEREAGLIWRAKVLPSNSLLAILAIPSKEAYRLEFQLKRLQKSDAIQDFSLKPIEWMRYVSLNPRFYDFKKKNWSFDWKDVENGSTKFPSFKDGKGKSSSKNQVDSKDLAILKEFQKRIPRSIADLDRGLGVDQFTLRYHYNHHAKSLIRGYNLKVVPRDVKKQALLYLEFRTSNDHFDDLRQIALSLPFTTAEFKMGSEYGWLASFPGEYANDILSYVGSKVNEEVGVECRYLFLDSTSESNQNLPYQLFDQQEKSWSYEPKIDLRAFDLDFEGIKSTCIYEKSGLCRVEPSHPRKCEQSSCAYVSK